MKATTKHLYIKKSTLPQAGKGLFTKEFIPKGTRIVEYIGRISSWRDADHRDGTNAYIYYVNRNHVIDAFTYKKAFARYANDANGLIKKEGVRNNACYEKNGSGVFITATRNIEAGEEIFVGYGKEYWDVIRKNKES
ncbi:MAG TPA: SET domain-containing protein [Chitinophagaceae bacterium]